MTTRLRCLIRTSTVALGTTLISLTGCGPSSNPATPSALSAGALYAMGGSTYRTIYQFKPIRAGNSYGPNGQLVAIGDVLYGTTQWGGHTGGPYGSGDGTVFSLTTSGRYFLYRFKGGSDGDSPNGGLAYVDGILYGTTLDGGSGCPGRRGCGTVFAITPSGQEHLLYRFKGGSDGIAPNGSLLWFDSKLYGTTAGGGVTSPCRGSGSIPGCGTIFSIDTSGNERVILASTATATEHPPMPVCLHSLENFTERRLPAELPAAATTPAARSSKFQRPELKKCFIVFKVETTGAVLREG
jgi:uncharacterized repeat protein (TIGR03803 family)